MVVKRNIKGIVFDFDGTLFDLVVDWQKLSEVLKKKYSIDSLAATNNFPKESKDQIIRTIGTHESRGIEAGHPMRSSQHVLNQLSKKYAIAITSRNNRSTIKKGLLKIGFNSKVNVVAREDVMMPKPHPEALLLTLDKMRLDANNVVVVGDTTHDLEAAKALDILCVIVKNPKLTFSPNGADYYIDSIVELPLLMEQIALGN